MHNRSFLGGSNRALKHLFLFTYKVKFSVFFVPFPLVCLGRLIVSRAIQDNAFDSGFADAEEFLKRPVLGDADYISSKWKIEVLDRTVFGLSYRKFNEIWHRVCLVAGLRVESRLYALRVGAGARPDEHREQTTTTCIGALLY